MARVKGKYSVMIIPPSTDGVRQYSIPQWIVPVALGVIGLLLIVTVVSTTVAVNSSSDNAELAAARQANEALQGRLADLNANVDALRNHLYALEDSEERVRTVFGLPEIDPAERALGTGGAVASADLSEVSEVDYAAFEVETEIDDLLRRCEFESDNFEDIYQALVDRKDQLDHTPSISPVPSHLVRGFGIKLDPFTGKHRLHAGVDLSAQVGTPVRAPADGKVVVTGYQARLGKMVTIDHGYGVKTRYGHLSKYVVKKGQKVKRGDIIAYTGQTGTVTGPHLHYEVHVNGRKVNPMKYIHDFEPWTEEPAYASNDGS
jgi:murein DD-endopeptidase MepM/ murein hydrolase activator NlpD